MESSVEMEDCLPVHPWSIHLWPSYSLPPKWPTYRIWCRVVR